MTSALKKLEQIKLSDKTKKIILLNAIFVIILTFTLHSLVDYDFWFHYDCGRYIVENGKIPTTAISSWYGLENNLPWISHEWAFGLLCYYLANLFGIASLPILASLIMATLVTFVASRCLNNSIKHPMLVTILVMASSILFIGATVMRPQLFLYAFTIALYFILENELNKPKSSIYWLIPLTILWVNLHGGSFILLFFFAILFFALDGIYFKMGRIEFKGCDKKTTLLRFGVLLLCLGLVVLNPHGLEMYSYPFSNMSDSVMLSTIVEWQPLDLNGFQLIFLVLPIIYFAIVVSRNEKIDGYSFIIMLAFTAMTLKSVRFAIQLNLIALYLIIRNIRFEDKHPNFSYLFSIPIIVIGCALLGLSNLKTIANEPFDKTTLPSNELIQVVKDDKAQRLYNHYNIGGYLTYQEIPVFIDGRADIYSKYNTMDFNVLTSCDYGFEGLLDKYNFDGFLVYKVENLADYLSKNNNYELKAEDDVFAYYVLAE